MNDPIKDAGYIQQMMSTKGWNEIVRPALNVKRESLIKQLLSATPDEFIEIRQAINAIDGLVDFIEVKLVEGKIALEELKNTRKDSSL